ncbi:hypothetical protein FFLO_00142 [Filobasidium floriforme]|uniref:Uncharacterized protein n=1 Tax=Filobasidium floriforme TaxID=5210 RepID=A0A8K0JWN6_9TREE|nr:uncharacterized protein HD553DRAFT_340502 [Filobasidium floriforme]KAG7579934.1 hypothetical protein FFLO_00142 [Filobasidium floriforme]KAH8087329.1 hypothetical protein HD553DRAFT_340502 [Filobasidium floriforme]
MEPSNTVPDDDAVSIGPLSTVSAKSYPTQITENTSVDARSDSDDESNLGEDPDSAQENYYEAALGDNCDWVVGHDGTRRDVFHAAIENLIAAPGAGTHATERKDGKAQEWQEPFILAIEGDTTEPKTQLHVFEINTEAFKEKYKLNFYPILVVYWDKEELNGLHFRLISEAISRQLLQYPNPHVIRPAWVAANSSAQAERSAEDKEAKEPEEPEV